MPRSEVGASPCRTLPSLDRGGLPSATAAATKWTPVERRPSARLRISRDSAASRISATRQMLARRSRDRSSLGKPSDREDERLTSYRRTDREAKDRAESRYKARKKYKAPAPPRLPDSSSHSSSVEPRFRVEREREVQPPPRKSRLFKTRAETKKAQVSWQLSGCNRSFDCDRERIPNDPMDVEQQGERVSDRRCRTRNHFDKDTSNGDEWQERDPIRRSNQHRQHTRLLDGKNTLQRSLSSPEFQAELIQVARKVRDKLDCTRRTIGESTADFRSLDHRGDGADARVRDCSFEKGSERVDGSPVTATAADSFTEERDAVECVSLNTRNRSGHWEDEGTTDRRGRGQSQDWGAIEDFQGCESIGRRSRRNQATVAGETRSRPSPRQARA